MPRLTSFLRRTSRWTLPAGLLIGLFALTAAPAEAAHHHVMIESYAYSSGNLSIDQGDTVTWTNHDSVEHDVIVTSGPESFRSPLLSKGESWSHTFSTPGSYSYICSLHPDMRATVTAAAAPAPPTSAAPTPPPTQQAVPTAPASSVSAEPQAAVPSTKGKQARSPKATTTEMPAAAVEPPVASADTPTASLNPLLLVAGASTAVVVFCLLLMASRPVPRPAESASVEEEKDSAHGSSSLTP
jgi:plastocyanin